MSANASENSNDADSCEKDTILLKNAYIDTQTSPIIASEYSISQNSIAEQYYIVQFKGNTIENWKLEIEDTGATIFDYVPNNAFVMRMDPSTRSQVETLDFVQWVGPYKPEYKISTYLSDPEDTTYNEENNSTHRDIVVTLFDVEENERILTEITALEGEITYNSGERVRVFIKDSEIENIAKIEGVSWIEEYVQPLILNDVVSDITNVYVCNNYGLTGIDQIIAVADTGLDTGIDNHRVNGDIHSDFDNRVTFLNYYGYSPDDKNGHGTHTAGSLAGDGTISGGNYKGVAYEADIIFQGVGDDEGSDKIYIQDLKQIYYDAYNRGARVHSNSWGTTPDGEYTILSQEIDKFVWNNKDLVVVFAAGNYGSEGDCTVSSPGSGKNVISVGASESLRPYMGDEANNAESVARFSSKGPTKDGRIKPDLVAPGTWVISTSSSLVDYEQPVSDYYSYMSGTSMSTTFVAGSSALVRQYYSQMGETSPSASLIKATLINGAMDMNLSYNEQGWGRIDLEKALYPAEPQKMIYQDSIELKTSQTWDAEYYVNNSSIPLRITLAWTDYPSAPFAEKTLVNDLDLMLTGPDGTYYGNDEDSVNNVEQIEIISPTEGWITIKVNGTNIPNGPQPFSLVVSGDLAEYVDFDPISYDSNSNGDIEKGEVMNAVYDYYNCKIKKYNLFEVIIIYLS